MAQAQYFSGLIVRVASERDRAAFVELFDHFAPRLKGYLINQGADDALAEEIAQDVMVTLWRKADLFDPKKSSASTWLYRIARNRRIDRLRRQKTAELDPEEPAHCSRRRCPMWPMRWMRGCGKSASAQH